MLPMHYTQITIWIFQGLTFIGCSFRYLCRILSGLLGKSPQKLWSLWSGLEVSALPVQIVLESLGPLQLFQAMAAKVSSLELPFWPRHPPFPLSEGASRSPLS